VAAQPPYSKVTMYQIAAVIIIVGLFCLIIPIILNLLDEIQ